jgi:type I restriction enzyme S subunit
VSRWERIKLGDICSLNPSKKQFQTLDEITDVSFIPMSNVTEDGKIYTSNSKLYSEVKSGFTYFIEDDVLFAKITPCMENGKGAIARGLINGLGVGSTEFHVLRPKKELVTSDWIYRFTSYSKFRKLAEKNMSGSAGQKRVPKAFLENALIPLPPLETQKQIAQTLDTATELLAMRKQQLAELDNLIKSTFYEMFGDSVTNEKGWDINRLDNCLSVIGGYAFKSNDFSDAGIPIIKIGNINSGVFHDNGISFWEYEKKLDKYLLHPNDIVISLTGTVGKDDYANVCILPEKYPDYYLNQRNAKLELKGNINAYYLLHVFKDSQIKGQLTCINRGIRQANISNGDIIAMSIPIPPLDLQNQFAAIVTKIEEQKALVQKAIDKTQFLFDSLMNDYFE